MMIAAAGIFLISMFSMVGAYFYNTAPTETVHHKAVVHMVKPKMPKQAQTLDGLAITNLAK